jgi:hypothetical protein
MQPVPLHMKLRCTGMEIPISNNFCPYNLRATSNKLYNKTIMQELEAFSFGRGSRLPSLKLRQTGRPLNVPSPLSLPLTQTVFAR